MILRFLRVRLGDTAGEAMDAIGSRYHKNIVIDHCSASWSVDECVSVYRAEDVTVQWCLIAESLYQSVHEGQPPPDSDRDGMPDGWELRYGLDPGDAADGAGHADDDGYTNLEEFLNRTDPTVYVDYTNPANNRFSWEVESSDATR